MYNGIGLRTARGSGTNGYVQKNLSFVKPKKQNNSEYKYDEQATAVPPRKPSDEVLLHKSRRQIENEVLEYEEQLQSQEKYTDEEITEMVNERRKKLLADLDRKLEAMKDDVLLEAKEREMKKMKTAFGIEDGAEEGRVFKKFESEKQRQLRLEREQQRRL